MTRRRKIIFGAGIGVVVLAVVGMNLRGRREKPIEVESAKVARGPVVEKVFASGKIQPDVQVKITPNVSGRIDQLAVKEGQRVEKGQFLVQLDRTRYEAAVEQGRAAVSSSEAQARLAQAQMEKAERDLERMRGIEAKGLTSQEAVDGAMTEVKVAHSTLEARQQDVAQARAMLRQGEDDLSKTRIASPMSGIVSQLNSEVGEVVLGTSQFEGTHIMTIADLTRMEVEVEVDENDIVNLALGDTTDIDVDAMPDTTFKGTVSEIANTAVTRGRGTQEEITHFAVKIAFIDVVQALRPGMSANVDIMTDRREDVVQIPIAAVTLREPVKPGGEDGDKKKKKEEGGHSVAVAAEEDAREGAPAGAGPRKPKMIEVVFVMKDGKVEQRPVDTGISGETNMEIRGGLQDGEEIVVGNYRVLSRDLKDGTAVKPAKPGKDGKGHGGGKDGGGESGGGEREGGD